MSTILDVAQLSGYSKSTVSRVVSGKGPVSKEAEQEIKKAMEKLNYTPNYFAQGMRTNKTSTIAVLIPDYTNPFYPELVKSIEQKLREYNYMIIVCDTDENKDKELKYIQEIVKRNIDGIIFCTYNRLEKNINYLIRISKNIPVIFMDKVIENNESISHVITDGFQGTREAAAYLINKGRKKIGYIKGSARDRVTRERFEGYKQGLQDYNILFKKDLVYTGNFNMKSGFRGAQAIIKSNSEVNAIMAATDVMAIGAMKYLKYADYKIPEEVNVVGFDNISLSSLIEPGLTTLAQPISRLGEEAASILINKIRGNESNRDQLELKGELIIRGSTASTQKSYNILEEKEKRIVY